MCVNLSTLLAAVACFFIYCLLCLFSTTLQITQNKKKASFKSKECKISIKTKREKSEGRERAQRRENESESSRWKAGHLFSTVWLVNPKIDVTGWDLEDIS